MARRTLLMIFGLLAAGTALAAIAMPILLNVFPIPDNAAQALLAAHEQLRRQRRPAGRLRGDVRGVEQPAARRARGHDRGEVHDGVDAVCGEGAHQRRVAHVLREVGDARQPQLGRHFAHIDGDHLCASAALSQGADQALAQKA